MAYKITLERPTPKMRGWTSKKVLTFSTKEDANKNKEALIKKHNLTRQKGFWGNSRTGLELSTNY